MGTAVAELQTCLYSRLIDDTDLMGQVVGVFDAVPERQSFPYVVVGDAREVPQDTFPAFGRVATLTITIYSMYAGFREAFLIADRIDNLVNRYAFPLNQYVSVYSMYRQLVTGRQSDGLTRTVTMTYDVFVEAGS